MADYATLKAAIQAVIYENGNQEITGSVMQATLLAMVNALGANYQYAGIATPSTNPGTPDQNVFYLASTAGTYVNFGNTVLAENEVAILKYNGSWTKEASGFASAEKVSQLDQILIPSSAYDFVLGTISGQGAESNNNKRARSNYIPARTNYVIRSDSDHQFSVRYYTDIRTFISTSGDWTRELSLANMPSNCTMFRIVARNAADTTISDVSNFVNYINFGPSLHSVVDQNKDLTQKFENLAVKRLAYNLVNNSVIDARIGNSNFGKSLSQTGWGASQFVDLQGASYVRLYRNINSTVTNASYSGVIFFDKDMVALTEGVSRVIYGNGGTDFADWTIHKVPAGAVYMRVSVTPAVATTYQYGIELYFLSTDNVAGLQGTEYTKTYVGEKIDLGSNSYEFRKLKSLAGGSQSAAIYGKYAIFVNDSFKTLVMFDMENFVTLATCRTGFPTSETLHCNQTQFGTLKYDPDDLFPLLYTAAQNDGNGRCQWLAYRIIPTLSDGEVSAFTVSLVQTIYLPIMSDANCLGNANPAFDYENNCIWAYSRNNNAEAANYLKARFTKFAIPAIYDGATLVQEVTLSDSDILDTFDADWSMAYAQGGFIKRGRLFIAQGGPSYDFTYLRGIDLYAQRQQVTFFDLMGAGVNEEPEGVFAYGGHIWVHTNSGLLSRIDV